VKHQRRNYSKKKHMWVIIVLGRQRQNSTNTKIVNIKLLE